MLVQVVPKNIAAHWDNLSIAIKAGMPIDIECSEIRMAKILNALVSEQMQLWASLGETSFSLVMTTIILNDIYSSEKDLLIYSFWVDKDQPNLNGTKIEDFETLKAFARGSNCRGIIGVTNDQGLAKLVINLGGRADKIFFQFSL